MSQPGPGAIPGEPTHEVVNQAVPLADLDLFATDRALVDAVRREAPGRDPGPLSAFGAALGRAETLEAGRLANEHPPRLRAFDRYGRRIDEVEFHPAWHRVMALAVEHGTHALAWRERTPGAHVERAAKLLLLSEVEAGACCPLTMTFAALPALAHEPALAAEWEPWLTATSYDPRPVHPAEKGSALCGMAMTEKQGGSDLRQISTRAEPRADGWFALYGHKWFCSAPMCDAFLTLARTEAGVTCFLVPRVLPDGARNAIGLQRLKDKLGNRSNASGEIEYRGTLARRVGEPGRGIATILEMVQHTRLDCIAGSAGLMRRAVAEALHHVSFRRAFGRRLADQPLMREVLADLAVDAEAAAATALRLARAFGLAADDPREAALARLATAACKFFFTKRAVEVTFEAMEVLGGNGYVEEFPLARLYREAPVNSIWEGSGNVIALDVIRACEREPAGLDALLGEVDAARGAHPALDG
ncbi:MAG: DNA alkylation response protein, partial [Acidobacteria bacterium]